MCKIINSPIAITIIVIAAAYVLIAREKSQIATEISGAYDTLVEIAEDATSAPEKTKAIQDFAEQIASQLKAGFSMGFSSHPGSDDGEESDNARYLRVRKLIKIENLKEIPAQFQSRQAVIFTLKNESEYPINMIKINFDYYRDGVLIDTKNEWLNEIKILDAGEMSSLKKERSFPNQASPEEMAELRFDEVKAKLTSFMILKE